MRRGDLLHQLGAAVTDFTGVLAPADLLEQVRSVCATARIAFGAAAVSVAVVEDGSLRYLAADGAGAEVIVGTQLPIGRGLAGYVALTGQALAVDRPSDDPRFARDVAERTGLVPASLLVVPIVDRSHGVSGVLSVLDRTASSADALVLASAFAAQLGLLVPLAADVDRVARMLLAAIVDAVAAGEPELAAALQRATARLPEPDADLARIAAVLGRVRRLDPAGRELVGRLLDDIVDLATPRRRR